MGRIIYVCHADDTPTGGIKVIYRHVELLTALGADAWIMHPTDLNFSCSWFAHNVRRLHSRELAPESDFVIVPEVWAGTVGLQCIRQHVRFGIFVQNGYSIHNLAVGEPDEALDRVYCAADLVLSISDDTTRMIQLNYPGLDPARVVRVRYSVNERFLSGANRPEPPGTPTISFMSRKLADHAARVAFALCQHLRRYPPRRNWQLEVIHNVTEVTVAEKLSASRIFLSFSECEGLPLPPLEAALSGNVVVGYTGQGAREYWHAPNFREIDQGDIHGFVTAACEAIRQVDAEELTQVQLAPVIRKLEAQYSPPAEAANLRMLLGRIQRCLESPPFASLEKV